MCMLQGLLRMRLLALRSGVAQQCSSQPPAAAEHNRRRNYRNKGYDLQSRTETCLPIMMYCS